MKSESDVRPAVILPLGNGACRYNYNVAERGQEAEAVHPSVRQQRRKRRNRSKRSFAPNRRGYDTVEAWGEPNCKDLVRAVIREEISETEEFGLINGCNAARAGFAEGAEAQEAETRYTAHLRRVAEVKAMVKADLATAGC